MRQRPLILRLQDHGELTSWSCLASEENGFWIDFLSLCRSHLLKYEIAVDHSQNVQSLALIFANT